MEQPRIDIFTDALQVAGSSVKSIAQYKYSINALYRNCNLDINTCNIVESIDTILHYILHKYTIVSTIKNNILYLRRFVMIILSPDQYAIVDNKFKEILSKMIVHAENSQIIASKRQQTNWRTWDDILHVRNSIKVKDMNYIIACLYTYIPPNRLDMCSLYNDIPVINQETSSYIDWQSEKIFMYADKINKQYPIDIPSELLAILKTWVASIKGSLYVLPNYDDIGHINRQTLARRLIKIFGVSCNVLRDIYVTCHRTESNVLKLKHAREMGHTLETHTAKYDKDINSKPYVYTPDSNIEHPYTEYIDPSWHDSPI